MQFDDSRTNRLIVAGVSALTVLTWYALPDAVRSRQARGVLKIGLVGVTVAGAVMVPRVDPEVRETEAALSGTTESTKTALALGVAAAATLGTIWFEKAVFAYGERRRARGARCGHTPLAVVLAAATGAAALVDWKRMSA